MQTSTFNLFLLCKDARDNNNNKDCLVSSCCCLGLDTIYLALRHIMCCGDIKCSNNKMCVCFHCFLILKLKVCARPAAIIHFIIQIFVIWSPPRYLHSRYLDIYTRSLAHILQPVNNWSGVIVKLKMGRSWHYPRTRGGGQKRLWSPIIYNCFYTTRFWLRGKQYFPPQKTKKKHIVIIMFPQFLRSEIETLLVRIPSRAVKKISRKVLQY